MLRISSLLCVVAFALASAPGAIPAQTIQRILGMEAFVVEEERPQAIRLRMMPSAMWFGPVALSVAALGLYLLLRPLLRPKKRFSTWHTGLGLIVATVGGVSALAVGREDTIAVDLPSKTISVSSSYYGLPTARETYPASDVLAVELHTVLDQACIVIPFRSGRALHLHELPAADATRGAELLADALPAPLHR